MAKRQTFYNPTWEEQEGFSWLARGNVSTSAHCKICKSSFAVGYQGFSAVQQHKKGSQH